MSQQSSRKKKFEGISYTVGNNLVRKTYLKNFNLIMQIFEFKNY